MEIRKLNRDSFREKVLKSYDSYLNISSLYKVAIGIYKNGELYVFGNGIDEKFFYDIGSISKTMTAHLILSLEEKRLVNLNDKVDKYLQLKAGKYPTIYELLTHTAGYNNLTPFEIVVPSLLKNGYAKKNIYTGCSEETVIKLLEKRNKHKGNYKYGYSDFAFAILSLVASKVAGISFSMLLESFIKYELGLSNSSLILEGDRIPIAANKNKVLPFWKWDLNNPYIASGGVTCNINDMLKYI